MIYHTDSILEERPYEVRGAEGAEVAHGAEVEAARIVGAQVVATKTRGTLAREQLRNSVRSRDLSEAAGRPLPLLALEDIRGENGDVDRGHFGIRDDHQDAIEGELRDLGQQLTKSEENITRRVLFQWRRKIQYDGERYLKEIKYKLRCSNKTEEKKECYLGDNE